MNHLRDHYIPGACNIGKDEIAKRKVELVASGVIVALLTIWCFFLPDSRLLWFLLFTSSSFMVLMHFQIRNKFCVAFGFFGRYNFGKRGKTEKTNDPEHIARDRKKVLVIALQTIMLSSAYTLLIYVIARSVRF